MDGGVFPETLLLTSKGYEPIGSLQDQEVSIWNGYDFEQTIVRKVASDTPLLHLKTKNTLELLCSEDFSFWWGKSTAPETVLVKDLEPGMRTLPIPNCPIIEGGSEEFPLSYSHGYYSGSERYWRDRLKVSRASIRGVRHGVLPYLELDLEKTTTTSLFYPSQLPPNFEVPLDPKYSVDTKLDWLAGLFDAGLMKRKIAPLKIWLLHSDSVDFLYRVKLLLQTLGIDSRHVPNKDHRFQHYTLMITHKAIEVLIDLGIPALIRDLRREPRHKNSHTKKINSPEVLSVEDAYRTSDIYNFESTTKQSAILNGLYTKSN